jgi:hypothetical protein
MPQTANQKFDFQIEGLVDRKYATYGDADPFRNRLPKKGLFLFVPPRPKELDLNGLMSNVELNGRTGVNYLLDASYLKPAVEVPGTAHLLLDVEDGRARLNVKPKVSRQKIAAEKRHPYDVWRGIIHAILFPMVLSHHYMDLVGTRYDEAYVPFLYVRGDKPALRSAWEGDADPKWGAPSAGSVIL